MLALSSRELLLKEQDGNTPLQFAVELKAPLEMVAAVAPLTYCELFDAANLAPVCRD